MDNLMESNERTLVMFDSVCLGLADCLALVHADMKQMSEQRNKLVIEQKYSQLDYDEQVAKKQIHSPQSETNGAGGGVFTIPRTDYDDDDDEADDDAKQVDDLVHTPSKKLPQSKLRSKSKGNLHDPSAHHDNDRGDDGDQDDDPHHLARLKLLDKRLAESFGHALSMCDQQNSSIAAKRNSAHQQPRRSSSLLNLLLGKTLGNSLHHSRSSRSAGQSMSSSNSGGTGNRRRASDFRQPVRSRESQQEQRRLVIDDINQHTRLAMQYSKQLEAHLFKIEDLHSRYEMHLKMGLATGAVGTTTRSHVSSSSSPASSSPALAGGTLSSRSSSLKRLSRPQRPSSKQFNKEYLDNIERLESEFEANMGSFMLSIEDIQGFARVCQGDVFEINIKYGADQKFKTKISVLKDNKQKCDNRQVVFKAKIAEVIAIKAYECKGALGKKVLLGNKLCETCDLFTARSQLMTISLNQTGSIKLNLIITWNPLHLVPSLTSASPLKQPQQNTTTNLPPTSTTSTPSPPPPPPMPISRAANYLSSFHLAQKASY